MDEGCTKVLAVLFIVVVVLTFVVMPIYIFIYSPGNNWGLLLVMLGVFGYFVAELFFDLDENRIFNIIYYIFMGFASVLLLRDIFQTDVEAGLELVLSVPAAMLVFFTVYVPLSRGMSEEASEWLLKGLGLLGNLIINGLIYLILKYLLPS